MLMRGDLQKLFDQINPIFENAFKKIEALEKEVEDLKGSQESVVAKQRQKPKVGASGEKEAA